MTWADTGPFPAGTGPTRRSSRPGSSASRSSPLISPINRSSSRCRSSRTLRQPWIDPIPRAEVAEFYRDFLGKPGPINHGQTINGYWIEQSRGRVGIPRRSTRSGRIGCRRTCSSTGSTSAVRPAAAPGATPATPAWSRTPTPCGRRMPAPASSPSTTSSCGSMPATTSGRVAGVRRDEVRFGGCIAGWGNPDTSKPRWVVTRYVPWTSWKAGQMQWGPRRCGKVRAPDHHPRDRAFRVPHRRQQQQPVRHTVPAGWIGTWDIMDRGSFNGPGWSAPAVGRAGDRRRVDAGRVHAPQPCALRVRAGRQRADVESERIGSLGARGRSRSRAPRRRARARARSRA